MIGFAEKSKIPYIFINGDEIINRIVVIINGCAGLTKEDIYSYCSVVNRKMKT